MHSLPHLQRHLQDLSQTHPVSLAYLFGSYARGTEDSQSDIDVAILTDPSLSKAERFALGLQLRSALALALGRDIDLVVLQDAPTLLQHNVIRAGQILYARDDAARRDFELSVEKRYDDEAPFLEREAQTTFDRILAHAR